MLPSDIINTLANLVVLSNDPDAITVAREFVEAQQIGGRCQKFERSEFSAWIDRIGIVATGTIRRQQVIDGPIVGQKEVAIKVVRPEDLDRIMAEGNALLLLSGNPVKDRTFTRANMRLPSFLAGRTYPICQFRGSPNVRNTVSVLYNVFCPVGVIQTPSIERDELALGLI